MLLSLLSKLKPSKFNYNVLIFVNTLLAFFLGTILGEISASIRFLDIDPQMVDNILFNLFILICYLFLYRSILIEVCKFLIKTPK